MAEDERLVELSASVEERRAAIQQLREALRTARAHNDHLEGASQEVTENNGLYKNINMKIFKKKENVSTWQNC